MKRLLVILFFLCTWGAYPMLQAQIYTTSSASYRSVSSGGVVILPADPAFRSTSAYVSRTARQITPSVNYSTASMRVANGQIATAASQLKGGVLVDPPVSYTEPKPHGPRRAPWVPDENVPLSDGWDVALLLAILCVGYVVWKYMSVRRSNG